MSRLLMTAAVLAALIYAMVLGVKWMTPRIEQDIANRVTTGLAEKGLLWADVAVKGREVVLSGEAPDADAEKDALTVAARVFGVAKVVDLLVLPGEVSPSVDMSATVVLAKKDKKAKHDETPYVLMMMKEGEKVTLSGAVPSEADRDVLVRLVNTHYPDGKADVSELVVVPGAPVGWRTAAGTVLFNMTNLENANVTLSGTEVMVSGVVLDRQFSEQMEQAVRDTLPASYKVAFAVDVVTPTVVKADVAAVEPAAGDVAKAAASDTCATLVDVRKERIHFDFDKAEIKPNEAKVVSHVASQMAGCVKEKMVLAGYTDASGSGLYNKWLSQQRAEAAMRGMMREGVAKERLNAVGYGDAYPVASNATRKGRAMNRRVEFVPGAELPHAMVPVKNRKAKTVIKVVKPLDKSEIKKPWWVREPAKADAAVERAERAVKAMVEISPTVAPAPVAKDKWLGDTN